VSEEFLVALVAVVPTTLAIFVGLLANLRSLRNDLRREIESPLGQGIKRLEGRVERLHTSVEHLATGQTDIRERLARLEGTIERQREEIWRPREASS
jgi:chromosome segregation ATPase